MKISKYIWLRIPLKAGLLFLFVAFCFSDCKKYSEDDVRYFSCSPKCRIVGGREKGWRVESFLVNGEDSTGLYYIYSPPISGYVGYTFGRKQTGRSSAYYIGAANDCDCKWSFSNNKKNIVIENGGGRKPLFISPYGTSQEWEIKKLTNIAFWLKTNYNGKDYFLKLKH